jgi:hypothetical protein
LSAYGIDIYPGGPVSAYRTYEHQSELYDAFLAGHGAPANPPGTSSHELGTAVDVESPEMRWVIDQIDWKYGWGRSTVPVSGGTRTISAAERRIGDPGHRRIGADAGGPRRTRVVFVGGKKAGVSVSLSL